MVCRIASVLLVASIAAAAHASAQSVAGKSVNFQPLEFLVGSCWTGTFPDGKQTDEHCFEWVFDRKFIRDRHTVRGGTPYGGETIYAWDASVGHPTFWYWNTDGQVITGQVHYTSEGIIFPERVVNEKGTTELKAVWRRLDADRYRVEQFAKAGEGWKELWTMEMKKTGKVKSEERRQG